MLRSIYGNIGFTADVGYFKYGYFNLILKGHKFLLYIDNIAIFILQYFQMFIQILLIASILGQLSTELARHIPTEAPIIPEEYYLAPGDELLITITGKVNYSYSSQITYEGKLLLKLPAGGISTSSGGVISRYEVVEAISVSGLRLTELEDTLTYYFSRYLKEVKVEVTLTNVRTGIVFVTGEVQRPGIYYATPFERVSVLIEKAGGVTAIGSKQNIKIIRKNQDTVRVNLEQFELTGGIENNPRVEISDVIYVPPVKGTATVKGAVFGRGEAKLRVSALTTEKERISEGVYELGENERISDLIFKAGGITPWADLVNSYIERFDPTKGVRIKIPIDLYKILFAHDSLSNLLIQNGDILVVPPQNTLVYVQGEVNRPGAFLFTPNLRCTDYIGQAGGPTHYANVRKIYINRQRKRISARSNPIVEPGDVIVVPRQTFKWWQDYATIISSIAIPVATALIYVRLTQ
jgi:protein involved in polysaccharide export with SLBB domain